MPAVEPLYAIPAKDPDARKVGELADGTPIWEKEFEEKVGEEPVVLNGQPQWVMAGQTPVKPRMRAVMQRVTKRYTEIVQPNGGIFKNFGFEPDPEERARLAHRAAIEETKQTLAEKLVERGISVDALLDAVTVSGSEDTPRTRKARA